MPTGQDVADYLGRGDEPDLVALAGEHLPVVTAMVRSYTRGLGFDEIGDPDDDVAAVILTMTARQTTNPTREQREQLGDYTRQPFPADFTLLERTILNRYRRRLA